MDQRAGDPARPIPGKAAEMSAIRATLLIAAVLGFAAAAQAQVYTQASLAPGQPYAIEVAPGTYMIQHAGSARAYPYVRCGRDCAPVAEPRSSAGRASPRRARTGSCADRRVCRKHAKKRDGKVINTTKIVREKPIVIEHRRVIDDPPREIERVHHEDGPPARRADVQMDEPRDRKRRRATPHPGRSRGNYPRPRPHEHPPVPQAERPRREGRSGVGVEPQ
jgi:hypothetical protein